MVQAMQAMKLGRLCRNRAGQAMQGRAGGEALQLGRHDRLGSVRDSHGAYEV